MKVIQVVRALESLAPTSLAAEWDNVGLLIGDDQARVNRAMLCIDLTEAVLAEAVKAKAQLVVAYHPPIFKPLSRLTTSSSPVVLAAAAAGIAVYGLHTALDAAPGGVNDMLAGVLGIVASAPIEQACDESQCKLVTFLPPEALPAVADAAFAAGAGRIGEYLDCAFFSHGIGAFCGRPGTRPARGKAGRHEAIEEVRLEVIAPRGLAGDVVRAVRDAHPYETPHVDIHPVETYLAGAGMGRVGELTRPVQAGTLVNRIKRALGLARVQVAWPRSGQAAKQTIHVAACCAGSCGSKFRSAIARGAEFYLTGEMRHHDALAAVGAGMAVCCVGHSHSERPILKIVAQQLSASCPGLKTHLARTDRDPFAIV